MDLKGETNSLIRKLGWSWEGLTAAFRSEKAIRQECAIALVSLVMSFIIPVSPAERIVVLILPLLMIATELLNTALEEVIDHISPEQHPMAKKAKDCGSAAVLLVAVAIGVSWLVVLLT